MKVFMTLYYTYNGSTKVAAFNKQTNSVKKLWYIASTKLLGEM